jgi:hypothetical protein
LRSPPATGFPRPARFRPRRFSRPRRLAPPCTLRVYFTPQPRSGFALQGVSPSTGRTSSSLAVALVTFTPTPCRCCLSIGSRNERPPSGPFSDRGSVTETWEFSPRPCPIPS